MSDEKKYTEREMVKAQRGGFECGAHWRAGNFFREGASDAARERYPMPKVTRPREKRLDDGSSRRIVDGKVFYRWSENDAWLPSSMTLNDIAELAHLFRCPTEEVPDDRDD